MQKKSSLRKVLFYVTAVLFNLAASFAHPVTPTIFTNLHLGSYMFGVALGSMMIVNFMFSPFWGKIITYISSRKCLLLNCAGYALGQVFFGLARTESGFIAARMFTGLFVSGSFVGLLTYVVNTAKDERQRGRDLTVIATIQSVGGAFGYMIGGLLGEISTYYAIWAQAALLFSCGIFFYLVCEDDTQVSFRSLKLSKLVKEVNPFSAFLASRQFMTLTFALLFGICALQNLGGTAFDQSFNYYIKDQFQFTSGYNGVLKGIMGLITLIANATIGLWMINRTDVRRSIIGVLAVCTVTMLGIVLTGSVLPFILINIVFYACSAVSIPVLQSMVAKKAHGGESNLIMGFYNSMKSLGGIIGAFASGALYTFAPKAPFVLCLAVFALAAVCAVIYQRRSQKEEETTAA
ncbi:MAG: MFS transporter [Negativicutes bacterium]|nr:MFS transporter [Negativicutes bacterium]